MTSKKETPKKSGSKAVKDLEGLSDEELDGVSGGGVGSTMTVTCCKGGGGGCGQGTGTTHEANVVAEKGDVELNPIRKK